MLSDSRDIIQAVATTVTEHNLGHPGHYRRHRTGDLDLYACTAAANILYTIGRLPTFGPDRDHWIATLQSFQNPNDGLFHHPDRHPFHTTASCLAALDLFDARPRHPLGGMAHLADKDAWLTYLDQLDWGANPIAAAEQSAGVYAARTLAGEATADWEDWYFDLLWEQTDWATGLWRHGHIGALGDQGLYPHLAGSFYHLCNVEYACRRLRFPTALLDCCIQIRDRTLWPTLGRQIGIVDLQWAYCLSRAVRHGGEKLRIGRHGLASLLHELYWFLRQPDVTGRDDWQDLTHLAGTVACLAEFQYVAPGNLRTERPLRRVLDRRPFI